MWQRHFSAEIAEKNSEVYSLIRKIYAKLFPQVYNLFLMLPKVVFLFLPVLHFGSFKLHFKILRLSSQNSPLFLQVCFERTYSNRERLRQKPGWSRRGKPSDLHT